MCQGHQRRHGQMRGNTRGSGLAQPALVLDLGHSDVQFPNFGVARRTEDVLSDSLSQPLAQAGPKQLPNAS